MEKISANISYEESIRSNTAIRLGIKNIPDDVQLANMKTVAEACFEPLRIWYDKPLKISSFFRSYELNKAIGGAVASQHMQGKAIDIDTGDNSENLKIYNWAKANLKFDQLIKEFPDANGNPSWVHISFDLGKNRNQTIIVNK